MRKNRLGDLSFDHEELARLLNMTVGNFRRQIINNKREIKAGELFIIAEFLKLEPLEVLETPEIHIPTTKASNKEQVISSTGYRHRLVACNQRAIDWISQGLQSTEGNVLEADMLAGKNHEHPYLPLVAGRALLGRATTQGKNKEIKASRRFSIVEEGQERDRMISRLYLEIYSCPEAPEIMLYLHGPIGWKSEGELNRRSPGQCISMTNGDRLHLPNEVILELDVLDNVDLSDQNIWS